MIETNLRPVGGFRFFGVNVGIKDSSLDFGGIVADRPCAAAGVFTLNTMPGAPVTVGREHLEDGRLSAVVVNSKNANVATGPAGLEHAREVCRAAAAALGVPAADVLPSSTGVIGRTLPVEKLTAAAARIPEWLGAGPEHQELFARAIMTTDTRPKWGLVRAGGATLLGFAKGAGMIEPNMATMLSYVVTDAQVEPAALRAMLRRCADASFNRISVDMDTSTSDTLVALADGTAGPVEPAEFEAALRELCVHLAKEVMRDAEGSKKLIELTVTGASDARQALATAKSIINSPLVKTAVHGADANWGRFVMAIGKVFDYRVDPRALKIHFGRGADRLTVDARAIDERSVDLKALVELLKRAEIFIEVDLAMGDFTETVWGCELSKEYVDINALYTT